MAFSANKVHLLGNVGSDPEMREAAGKPVANLTMATQRFNKDDPPDWHRLTVWGKLAEIFNTHVRKGDKIYVEGRIRNDSYEKDGVRIYTSEVVVDELVMCGSKKEAGGSTGGGGARSAPAPSKEAADDDDLPF